MHLGSGAHLTQRLVWKLFQQMPAVGPPCPAPEVSQPDAARFCKNSTLVLSHPLSSSSSKLFSERRAGVSATEQLCFRYLMYPLLISRTFHISNVCL